MTRWRCNSCETVYEDTAENGVRIYHACAPLKDGRERPDKRDENPHPDSDYYRHMENQGPWTKLPIPIVAEGRGRIKVEP